MNKTTATILGFVIAPLVPSVYGTLTTPITRNFDLITQLPLMAMYYPMAMAFTAAFGIPAFLVVRRFGLIRWWTALAAGIAIGAIVVVLIHLPNSMPSIVDFIKLCVLGGATGLSFWGIWKCGHESESRNHSVSQTG